MAFKNFQFLINFCNRPHLKNFNTKDKNGHNNIIPNTSTHTNTQSNDVVEEREDNNIQSDTSSHTTYQYNNIDNTGDYDNIAKDLMKLVGHAIDEWAKLYNLESLPKNIVFQQALTILNAVDKVFTKGDNE